MHDVLDRHRLTPDLDLAIEHRLHVPGVTGVGRSWIAAECEARLVPLGLSRRFAVDHRARAVHDHQYAGQASGAGRDDHGVADAAERGAQCIDDALGEFAGIDAPVPPCKAT